MVNTIALAQGKPSEIIVGTNHIINAAVLKEERVIHIDTPEGYSDSKKRIPFTLHTRWAIVFFKRCRNTKSPADSQFYPRNDYCRY